MTRRDEVIAAYREEKRQDLMKIGLTAEQIDALVEIMTDLRAELYDLNEHILDVEFPNRWD